MAQSLLQQLLAARKKAEGPDGPDKQQARVLFHTLVWERWDEIHKALDKGAKAKP